MYEARVIGVERVVGPMVESPGRSTSTSAAVNMAFPAEERDQVQFCVNIETRHRRARTSTAMLELPEIGELDGIVLGRVDMSGSLGLTREDINSEPVSEIARDLFAQAKAQRPRVRDRRRRVRRHARVHAPAARGHPRSVRDAQGGLRVPRGPRRRRRRRASSRPSASSSCGSRTSATSTAASSRRTTLRIEMLQSRYDRLIEHAGGLYE